MQPRRADSANDGLPGLGEFAKESKILNDHRPSRLEIGSLRREHRLGYEFDTDVDTFALFDSETRTRFADQCVSYAVELQRSSR